MRAVDNLIKHSTGGVVDLCMYVGLSICDFNFPFFPSPAARYSVLEIVKQPRQSLVNCDNIGLLVLESNPPRCDARDSQPTSSSRLGGYRRIFPTRNSK